MHQGRGLKPLRSSGAQCEASILFNKLSHAAAWLSRCKKSGLRAGSRPAHDPRQLFRAPSQGQPHRIGHKILPLHRTIRRKGLQRFNQCALGQQTCKHGHGLARISAAPEQHHHRKRQQMVGLVPARAGNGRVNRH